MTMTISIDDKLKKDFAAVCKEIGLSPSTAITIFAKTVVREQGFPFDLSAMSLQDRYATIGDADAEEEAKPQPKKTKKA